MKRGKWCTTVTEKTAKTTISLPHFRSGSSKVRELCTLLNQRRLQLVEVMSRGHFIGKLKSQGS